MDSPWGLNVVEQDMGGFIWDMPWEGFFEQKEAFMDAQGSSPAVESKLGQRNFPAQMGAGLQGDLSQVAL